MARSLSAWTIFKNIKTWRAINSDSVKHLPTSYVFVLYLVRNLLKKMTVKAGGKKSYNSSVCPTKNTSTRMWIKYGTC